MEGLVAHVSLGIDDRSKFRVRRVCSGLGSSTSILYPSKSSVRVFVGERALRERRSKNYCESRSETGRSIWTYMLPSGF